MIGAGNDILISGATKFDTDSAADVTALDAVLDEWASSATYPQRIKAISAGVGKNHADGFNSATVRPDSSADTLSDRTNLSRSSNWFLVAKNARVRKKPHETKTII